MSAHLKIYPIKSKNQGIKLKRKLDQHLPDISKGVLMSICAPVCTGKSTVISNMLLSSEFYRDLFDTVYIISPTIFADDTSEHIVEAFEETIFDEYSDKIVDDIVDYQKSFSKKEMPFICIIVDDFIGIKDNSKIFKLASKFRHWNIGLLVFASQVFKAIPPLIRSNSTSFIFGKTPNEDEYSKVSEEYSSLYKGKKNFLKLYEYATSDEYSFLYLNLKSNPAKAYKNFTELIYDGKNLIK